MSKELPPWVPTELQRRTEPLTDRDYAEGALVNLCIRLHPQPAALDSESLAEAVTYLDLMGHSDAAGRLVDAAHEMDAAIQNALKVLKT